MATAMAFNPPAPPQRLLKDLHVAYVQSLDAKKDGLQYHVTTHLRMNGVYWGLCSLELMGQGDLFARDDVVAFVKSCWDHPSSSSSSIASSSSDVKGKGKEREVRGGFAPFPRHDAHILSTLSALQILAMKDALGAVDREPFIQFILSLRSTDPSLPGAFYGDTTHLEHDTRFVYCAIYALLLLGAHDEIEAIREETIEYVLRCMNPDGGFGTGIAAESHSGQVFTCLATLNILRALSRIDADHVGAWLCERQLPNGGLNGRPQKLEDVCYSWWVLSSLSMVQRLHWINARKLRRFILSAQDPEYGGIADRPDNVADVFHTLFGIAGISLLNGLDEDEDGGQEDKEAKAARLQLEEVDPTYCLPAKLVKKLGVQRPYQSFLTHVEG